MNEQESRMWQIFYAAAAKLHKGLPAAKGGAKAEEAYGNAYQQLVQHGYAPQLRRKYRQQ